MLNVYQFIKNSTMIAILVALAWFGANAFVNAQQGEVNPPVETLEGQPELKLLSEMTEEEKAQLTKEERASLEELEQKLEEMKQQQPQQHQ